MHMVPRCWALICCWCALHRRFVSSEWPGVTGPLPLPLLSPEHGPYPVLSVGGRLPCCFISTEPEQTDSSLVLLRAGDRKQEPREWKEMGITVPLGPLSAAAFHHNVWASTTGRSQEPETHLLSNNWIIGGGALILFLDFSYGGLLCNWRCPSAAGPLQVMWCFLLQKNLTLWNCLLLLWSSKNFSLKWTFSPGISCLCLQKNSMQLKLRTI